MFKRFRKSEKGQGMVEYGLILALVAVVAIFSLTDVGTTVKDMFTNVFDGSGIVGGGGSGGDVGNPDWPGAGESAGANSSFDDLVAKKPQYTDSQIQALVDQGYTPIATADELDNIRNGGTHTFGKGSTWEGEYASGLSRRYVQVKDIDLKKFDNFEPIGNEDSYFRGTFDGGGFVISNLKIERLESYVGLFGWTENSTLKNIGLENIDVKGDQYVGGLIGNHNVAYQQYTRVSDIHISGSVSGLGMYVGGFSGRSSGNATMTNIYTNVNVSGVQNVGGIFGQINTGAINESAVFGDTQGSGKHIGGISGYSSSFRADQNFVSGNVSGLTYVGGISGFNWGTSNGRSPINNSYVTGSVTGIGDHVGGIVGHSMSSESTPRYTYATGRVMGVGISVGGLAGDQSYGAWDSYYDRYTTGQASGKGIGLTTAEMKNPETYKEWHQFDRIWTIKDGQYPTLQWQWK